MQLNLSAQEGNGRQVLVIALLAAVILTKADNRNIQLQKCHAPRSLCSSLSRQCTNTTAVRSVNRLIFESKLDSEWVTHHLESRVLKPMTDLRNLLMKERSQRRSVPQGALHPTHQYWPLPAARLHSPALFYPCHAAAAAYAADAAADAAELLACAVADAAGAAACAGHAAACAG